MIVSKRHKRSVVITRVVTRADRVPVDEWRRVWPPVLEGQGFFRALDDARLDQFSFFYVLAYRRNALVGIAPCFFMDYPLDTSINGPLRRVTNAIKRLSPGIMSLRALVCGCPIDRGRIGLGEDKEEILRAMVRRIEQLAKKKRASVIAFKDFDRSYDSLLGRLEKGGFSKFNSLPTTELKIAFSDFEGYLKTLSAASRYDLRRKFRKVDGSVKLQMEVTSFPDKDTLKEIHNLYLQTEGAHEMGFEVLTEDFFRNMSRELPENARYFLWRKDGRLIAFVFCLVSKERLIDYYVGLDYAVAYDYHLYFLKFRDILNWSMKQGIEVYEMGITGYEPKRRLGFSMVPLHLYVKHRNRLIRPLFKIICQFLRFDNFDPALKKYRERKKHA